MAQTQKTNLLIKDLTTSKIGLLYLFTAVFCLGLGLLAAGSIALIGNSQHRARLESAKKAYRAVRIDTFSSNEKANPGNIALYLNDSFAGALTDDSQFSPALEVPPEGPLALLFLNPTTTQLPTNAEFLPQTFTSSSGDSRLTICTPRVTGGTTLWIRNDGASFRDSFLTQLARAC